MIIQISHISRGFQPFLVKKTPPPKKTLFLRYELKYIRYLLNCLERTMTKPKMGRPVVGATTKKCSFSLNIEVLEDLKFIADTIGVSRSAFLTMLLSESLPILKVSAAAIASGKSDPVSVAKRYSDDAKAILDERMNYLRANKNANKLSS